MIAGPVNRFAYAKTQAATPGKAFIAAVLTVFMCCMLLTSCRRLVPEEDETISVYASFYPIYALADGVTRSVPDVELHCLVQPQDGCLRSYQLSDWDLALLKRGADAVISGGRGLESFEDALFTLGKEGPAVSAVLYNIDLYAREDEKDPLIQANEHFNGDNPHLYMSVSGAAQIVESISAAMISLDPGYADLYAENAEKAIEALNALHNANTEKLSEYRGTPVIIMNEALGYVALEYGFSIASWVGRESGESVSGDTLSACIESLSQTHASTVLIEKQAPAALTEALKAAGFCVIPLDVFSTHREGEGFEQYIEIQQKNAQGIWDALNADPGRKELD